jgi:adenylate cyclase
VPNLQGRPIAFAVERGCSLDQHVAQRKRAAILCADVTAYSRLMGDDEKEAVRALQDSRALVDRFVVAARGRVFGAVGDSVAAEFPSLVEALECARDVQKAIAERNQDVAEERRIRFRIGANLGDALVEGENLYGDGVNVAARV